MDGFVEEVEDISSEGGFQFRFHCDRCTGTFTSTSRDTLAGKILSMAGRKLGGAVREASATAHEVDGTLGRAAREKALEVALTEAQSHFHRCPRCGKWVCVTKCWNQAAYACDSCAPRPDVEDAVRRMHESDRAKQEKQEAEDRMYDRSSVARTLHAKEVLGVTCPKCDAAGRRGSFCDACGAPLQAAPTACPACGEKNAAGARFCQACGGKL